MTEAVNRRPNTECDQCGAPIYRRPGDLAKRSGKFCNNTCRADFVRDSRPTTCSVEGCSGVWHARGLCRAHYSETRATPCSVPACGGDTSQGGRGMCGKHYRAVRAAERDADPDIPRCLFLACDRARTSHGYCDSHKHHALDAGRVGEPCIVEGCTASRRGRGLCSRHWSRARTYGLTVEQLADFETRPCAVCGGAGEVIDHDHVTGEVRDVLCQGCNKAAGTLEDNPDRIRALADYIEFHNQKRTT